MTQEEKAKAYDEAIERAKKLQETCDSTAVVGWCEYIFPELKEESEDERIRKELLEHCKNQAKPYIQTGNKCPQIQSWIDWLEKQGEQKVTVVDFKAKDWYVSKVDGKIRNIYHSVDEVEPKFKVGDWITNGACVIQITSVDDEYYWQDNDCVGSDIESIDKEYHLWTIKDAKEGDVLSYVTDEEDLWVMIYWSLYEPYEGHVHYHALLVNDEFYDKGTCCICINDLKPATKEQRDTLFAKMKEAGYEWDAEKKKLLSKPIKYNSNPPSIDKKSDWSEEDERNLNDAILFIETGTYSLDKDNLINWLKSLRPQPKQEWSEEDKKMFKSLKTLLNDASCYSCTEGVDKILAWLKQKIGE